MLPELARRLLAFGVLGSVACSGASNDEPEKPTVPAKVVGTVTLREGDCMPVTTPERCRLSRLATRVEAYAVIRAPMDGKLVPAGVTPVQTTASDAEGRFSFVLPEGRYTIITFYDGAWYPTSQRSDGEWAAVEVNAAWLEDVTLEIDLATE